MALGIPHWTLRRSISRYTEWIERVFLDARDALIVHISRYIWHLTVPEDADCIADIRPHIAPSFMCKSMVKSPHYVSSPAPNISPLRSWCLARDRLKQPGGWRRQENSFQLRVWAIAKRGGVGLVLCTDTDSNFEGGWKLRAWPAREPVFGSGGHWVRATVVEGELCLVRGAYVPANLTPEGFFSFERGDWRDWRFLTEAKL